MIDDKIRGNKVEMSQSDKISKNTRILDMYIRLCEGKVINKEEEVQKYRINKRSVQRDLDDIRFFLEERAYQIGDKRTLEYDRAKNGYVLKGAEASLMSNSEILAVSKILLESRAFSKREINSILKKLIAGCVPLKDMKVVSELIANEQFHYVELSHSTYIQDKLWELGESIKECELLEITYQKQVSSKEKVRRVVEPVAILFSEYYFYLNAYIMERDEQGHYTQKYNNPAIFRLDRIEDFKQLGEKFQIAYADRFEEGEFRKRVQFMFAGELEHVRIRYTGTNVEAILDRLPTARIVEKEEDGSCLVDAEVYGTGILMWLLSQGTNVEVVRPESLRERMKQTLEEMIKRYD